MTVFTYTIEEDTNTVKIFQDGMCAITQPFVPETFQPFATYEEAQAWAEAVIAERQSWVDLPPESPEEGTV